MRSCLALTGVLFLILGSRGEGADQPRKRDQVFASAALRADAEVMRRVLEAAHPGLYRYHTRATLEERFAALNAEFGRDRTLAEAFVVLSRFLATLQCGHTYTNFFNQPTDIVAALFEGKDRVPFLFRWLDGRMIVTRDLSAEKVLPPGTEIRSLDGVTPREILAAMMSVARADGSNDAKRRAYLELTGLSRYEAFDIYLPLLFPGVGRNGTVRLVVKQPGQADDRVLTVAALDTASRAALAKESSGNTGPADSALWSFAKLSAETAYLRMPSWALFNTKWDWRRFLDAGFDDLIDRKVPGLIVDLRGNEGGLDVGNAILARLIPRPIAATQYQRYTRYRTWPLPRSYDAYLSTWDWSFKDWGKSAEEGRSGYFRLRRYDDNPEGDAIAPRGRRYEGKVVVLIDSSNSSATFQFARLVKDTKLATLVGQTTGGNLRGINGGAFFFVKLPNTHIEFDLPLIATFSGDDRPDGVTLPFARIPDAGVEPDVRVTSLAEDVARGVDPELAAAQLVLSGSPSPP